MWRIGAWAAMLGVLGCSEYEFSGEERVEPVGNPRELASTEHVDRIRQVGIPEVDVLWVVDNSCSMWEEQTALATYFPAFMRYFVGSGLDYHIGVVSTDMEDASHQGRLRQVAGYRFIDEATPDPVGTFMQMAMMGTGGHWDEEGFAAVHAAIDVEGLGYNAGFFREKGSFHTVVISDEDDYSDEWTASEFQGWLRGLKSASSLVTFSSIVGPEEVCPGAAEPGAEYLSVTRGLGGVEWSICSSEWEAVLDALGLAATGLQREYYLSRLPVPSTIVVEVIEDGVVFAFEPDLDWVYDATRNSVRFLEYVPQPLAEVSVRYTVLDQ